MSATFYDDPNREAIGLAPIWTGAGEVTATKTKADTDADDEPAKAKTTKSGS